MRVVMPEKKGLPINWMMGLATAIVVGLCVAWYTTVQEHKSGARLDKEAHAREILSDKQVAREQQFYDKIEKTIALTVSNQQHYIVIENQMRVLESANNSLEGRINGLDTDVRTTARELQYLRGTLKVHPSK